MRIGLNKLGGGIGSGAAIAIAIGLPLTLSGGGSRPNGGAGSIPNGGGARKTGSGDPDGNRNGEPRLVGHDARGDPGHSRSPYAGAGDGDISCWPMSRGPRPRALCGVPSTVLTESVNGGLEDMRTTVGLCGTGADVIRMTLLGAGEACDRRPGDERCPGSGLAALST